LIEVLAVQLGSVSGITNMVQQKRGCSCCHRRGEPW